MSDINLRKLKTCIFAITLLVLLMPVLSNAGMAEQNSVDFGDVPVNTSRSFDLVIQNTNEDPIYVSCSFRMNGEMGFIAEVPKGEIQPGQKVTIEITFTPEKADFCFDHLYLYYGPAPENVVIMDQRIAVQGNGILGGIYTMGGLLEYYKASVQKGDLVGEGNGNSAVQRLQVFGKMLENAEKAINAGEVDEGLEFLRAAHRKINVFVKDGNKDGEVVEAATAVVNVEDGSEDAENARAIPELKKMIEYLLEHPA